MTSSIRSLSTLLYNGLFFSVFMYLFAVIGITLFCVLTGEDWTDLRYNLVLVGAILNNYQVVMAELKEKREGG
jgi:ABC-type iron transport system FetAB permease component